MTDTRPPFRPSEPPPHHGEREDELDGLLRAWHSQNAERAAAGRERLMASLRAEREAATVVARIDGAGAASERQGSGTDRAAVDSFGTAGGRWQLLRSLAMSPYTRAAACLMLLATLAVLFLPLPQSTAIADDGLVMIPDGGRLEALDAEGRLLGPVPLQHTDVRIAVSGPFARVALRQTYRNPYQVPIEAIYTFPMSHRAAVDRMTMTIGDRIIEGEVRERDAARRLYESARRQGHVAALLEQERPNIFTQSVANIEPGATIEIDIAYIEMVSSRDGTHEIAFPMTVAPRYVPGSPSGPAPPWLGDMPRRQGVVLRGPATIEPFQGEGPTISGDVLAQSLQRAVAVAHESVDGILVEEDALTFRATYADGTSENGIVDRFGLGMIAGRAFRCPPLPEPLPEPMPGARGARGGSFAGPTDQVPDAHRVTPQPVRPPLRAGHDVSIEAVIDTGGSALVEVQSAAHAVERADDGRGRARLTLARQREIPNRDFVLRWRTDAESVTDSIFTHFDAADGGFVTVVIAPPARVTPDAIPPRELIFVLDSSGSMNGFPIEKSKALMERALASMRPTDSFNIITFAGATRILWPKPRAATPENVSEAQTMLASLRSGGGTEMMSAIEAALAPDAASGMGVDALANLPADGRRVEIVVPMTTVHQEGDGLLLRTTTGIAIPLRLTMHLPTVLQPEGVTLRLAGRWNTEQGQRVLAVESAGFAEPKPMAPLRMVVFLTDGLVANEAAIIDAVRKHARTTRVFSLGIGSSVNRSLVEQIALAGRGESEIVMLADHADAAVARLVRRLETPVLTDIEVRFEGIEVTDLVAGIPSAAPGLLPDLFEERPLILHGRYTTPGTGTVHLRGRTADGVWETQRGLTLPGKETGERTGAAALPALWARSTVDQILAPHLAAQQLNATPLDVRQRIVALGERHRIVTPFTSFVAVERSRVILGGQPMTVTVPIEMAEGLQWEGIFGKQHTAPYVLGRSDVIIDRPGRRLDPGSGAASSRGGGGEGRLADEMTVLRGRGAGQIVAPSSAPPPPPGSTPQSNETTFPWQRGRALDADSAESGVDRRAIGGRAVEGSTPARPSGPGRRPVGPPMAPPGSGGFGGGGAASDADKLHAGDSDTRLRRSISGLFEESPESEAFWFHEILRAEASRGPVLSRFLQAAYAAATIEPDDDALVAAADRAVTVPLDDALPSDTAIAHPIDDLVAATVGAVGRSERINLSATDAGARIAVAIRERVFVRLAREVFDEQPNFPLIGARADSLIVVGDATVQLTAQSLLDELRAGFSIPPRAALAISAALQTRLDAERTDAERLEGRIRAIARRLEPALFAAVVERLDPDAEVVDRAALLAQLGDAIIPDANDTLLISVLLDDRARLADAATLAALREAGLRIDATVERMPGVVGEIAVESLADLAEVDGVRRIGRANPRSVPRTVRSP